MCGEEQNLRGAHARPHLDILAPRASAACLPLAHSQLPYWWQSLSNPFPCASHSQTLPAAYGIKSKFPDTAFMSTSCSPITHPTPHFLFRVLVFNAFAYSVPSAWTFLCFLLCCAHFLLTFRKATSSTHITSRKTLTSQAGLRAPPIFPGLA